jgi:hypothetical protein
MRREENSDKSDDDYNDSNSENLVDVEIFDGEGNKTVEKKKANEPTSKNFIK